MFYMGLLTQWLNTAALPLSENMSSCQKGSFLIALRAAVSKHIINTINPFKIPLRDTSQYHYYYYYHFFFFTVVEIAVEKYDQSSSAFQCRGLVLMWHKTC